MNAVVVLGVTGGIEKHQFAAIQQHRFIVLHRPHPAGFNRQQLAVAACHFRLAIHRAGAGIKNAWINHVACTARVQQQRGIRQFLHQLPGAAGMIQMHMGQDQVLHLFHCNPFAFQCTQQQRYRIAGATVDQCRLATFNDQV